MQLLDPSNAGQRLADMTPDIDVVKIARSSIDTVDLDAMSDTVADAASTALDAAGALAAVTGDASVAGSRLVVRSARVTGRAVRRYPRTSVGTVSVVALLLLFWIWKRRGDDADATDL